MSAEKCPVCGCVEFNDRSQFHELLCGCDDNGEGCEHAERLAIERAAEIERLKAMLAPKWTDRRAAQLEDLARLINRCRSLNTSSGVIAALSSIEQLGDELSTADTEAIEPSFIEFLAQLCREDRRNQKQEK